MMDSNALWTVRMLGRMEVVSRSGDRPKFRSKSVQALLAYLALHPGKEISRFLLEETLWPDSDSDKQSQNLRRAVADLRDALEVDSDRGSVIETRRDIVSGSTRMIATDATRFFELSTGGLRQDDEEALSEAVALYGGPLLAPLGDDWIYAYRLEYEERYGQCVDTLCRMRVANGSAKESVRIARAAILVAPTREDIHVALIHAYRSAGLEIEALRQYEDLERMMDENWGEAPSKQAREALEGRIYSPVVAPPATAPEPESAGGAMGLGSRFYVRRKADSQSEDCLDRKESVILVQGPRQVGKSSLLARSLAYSRGKGLATVLTDFQTFGESQLADEERLYKTLAHSFATQLKLEFDLTTTWNTWLGSNMNLDAVLSKLLSEVDGQVCWAIDEADRLFGRAYANDFFGLLRSWHNRRALDPEGPWIKLTLILSYATEAHLFITDLNQSPFNVGVRLPLRDFSPEEVSELASRYGITEREAVDVTYRTTNGHPFLARRALVYICQGGSSSELEASSVLADGPFGDHMQGVLGSILKDEEMLGEVTRLLRGKPFLKPTTQYRLMAAGVLAMRPSSRIEFRVPAYRIFLNAALS